MLENVGNRSLDHIHDVIKPGIPTVVGIRHVRGPRVIKKITQQFDFGSRFLMHRLNIREIFAVHGNDQLECLEIRNRNFSRSAEQLDSAFPSRCLHPRIRLMTSMISNRPGRIDDYRLFQPTLADERLKNAFPGRRATDVAKANEQYLFESGLVRCQGISLYRLLGSAAATKTYLKLAWVGGNGSKPNAAQRIRRFQFDNPPEFRWASPFFGLPIVDEATSPSEVTLKGLVCPLPKSNCEAIRES